MNPTEEAAARPKRIGVLVAVAAAALAVDAVTKVVVVALLQNKAPVVLLGGLLKLRVLRNSGAAFNIGTGTGMTIVFTVIAAGVVVAILRYARRLRSLPWAIALGLLLGGALGNLADRVLRAPAPLQGHVVDWIELPHWPVFNVADSAIVCGGVLAVLLASRGLQVDGTVYRDGAGAQDGAVAVEGAEGAAEPRHAEGAEGADDAPGTDGAGRPEGTGRGAGEAAAPGEGSAPPRHEATAEGRADAAAGLGTGVRPRGCSGPSGGPAADAPAGTAADAATAGTAPGAEEGTAEDRVGTAGAAPRQDEVPPAGTVRDTGR